MKSGKLNILEPSGPLRARNGTALPLLLDGLKMLFLVSELWDGIANHDDMRQRLDKEGAVSEIRN